MELLCTDSYTVRSLTASVTFYFATPTFSKGGGGDNGKWAGAGGGRAVGG